MVISFGFSPRFSPGKHHAPVHPNAMRVSSRHQRGTRRSAGRVGNVELPQHVPFLRHPVEVWRLVHRIAERADISVAHVVNKDENDVRLVRTANVELVAECQCEKHKKAHAETRRRKGFVYQNVIGVLILFGSGLEFWLRCLRKDVFQLDLHWWAGMKLESEQSLLCRLRAVVVDDIDSKITVQPVLQVVSFGANND